jgi:hypothetical protein
MSNRQTSFSLPEDSMTRVLGIAIVLAVLALPALAQVQQMTADDQQTFDNYYSRWLQDRQTNDRQDMMNDEQHMQDLMNKYAIPSNTPYDSVASPSATPAPNNYARDDRSSASEWQGRLPADDQDKFNKEYTKWQEANAKNDRNEIDKHARNLEEIMQRNNIPPNTPFADLATVTGYQPRVNVAEYQGRLSPDDQRRFDKAYEHWQSDRARNNRGDAAKDEGKMQEIMAKYNIPREVPYSALASGNRGY